MTDVIAIGVLLAVLLVQAWRTRDRRLLAGLDVELGPIVRAALDEDANRLLGAGVR